MADPGAGDEEIKYKSYTLPELKRLYKIRQNLPGLPILQPDERADIIKTLRRQDIILLLRRDLNITNRPPIGAIIELDQVRDYVAVVHTELLNIYREDYAAQYSPRGQPSPYPSTLPELQNLYDIRRRFRMIDDRRPQNVRDAIRALQTQDAGLTKNLENYLPLANEDQVAAFTLYFLQNDGEKLLTEARRENQAADAMYPTPFPPGGRFVQPFLVEDDPWQVWWDGVPPSQQLEPLWNEMIWHMTATESLSHETFLSTLTQLNAIARPSAPSRYWACETIFKIMEDKTKEGTNPGGEPLPPAFERLWNRLPTHTDEWARFRYHMRIFMNKVRSFWRLQVDEDVVAKLSLRTLMSALRDAMINRMAWLRYNDGTGRIDEGQQMSYQWSFSDFFGIEISEPWTRFFAEHAMFRDEKAKDEFLEDNFLEILSSFNVEPVDFLEHHDLNRYTNMPLPKRIDPPTNEYRAIYNPAADNALEFVNTGTSCHETLNSHNKPKLIKLAMNEDAMFGWWGNYVDDGPQEEGEDNIVYRRRVYMARDNMRIERRLLPTLPPLPLSSDRDEPEAQRELQEHIEDCERKIKEHNEKMNLDRPGYDRVYREDFQRRAREAHERNNVRRKAAIKYRNTEAERVAPDKAKYSTVKPKKPRPNLLDLYEDIDEGPDPYGDAPIRDPRDKEKVEDDDEDGIQSGKKNNKRSKKCTKCVTDRKSCEPHPKKTPAGQRFPCERCVRLGEKKPEIREECAIAPEQKRAQRVTGPFLISYWARNLAWESLEDIPLLRNDPDRRTVRRDMSAPRPRQRSTSPSSPPNQESYRHREVMGPGKRRGRPSKPKSDCQFCQTFRHFGCDRKRPCNNCKKLNGNCQYDYENNTYLAHPPTQPAPPPAARPPPGWSQGASGGLAKCRNCYKSKRECDRGPQGRQRPCQTCVEYGEEEFCEVAEADRPALQKQGKQSASSGQRQPYSTIGPANRPLQQHMHEPFPPNDDQPPGDDGNMEDYLDEELDLAEQEALFNSMSTQGNINSHPQAPPPPPSGRPRLPPSDGISNRVDFNAIFRSVGRPGQPPPARNFDPFGPAPTGASNPPAGQNTGNIAPNPIGQSPAPPQAPPQPPMPVQTPAREARNTVAGLAASQTGRFSVHVEDDPMDIDLDETADDDTNVSNMFPEQRAQLLPRTATPGMAALQISSRQLPIRAGAVRPAARTRPAPASRTEGTERTRQKTAPSPASSSSSFREPNADELLFEDLIGEQVFARRSDSAAYTAPAVPQVPEAPAATGPAYDASLSPTSQPRKWQHRSVRAGYDTRSNVSFNSLRCDESREPGIRCSNPGALPCDHTSCTKLVCQLHHTKQNEERKATEERLIDNSKLWYCEACRLNLNQDRTAGRARNLCIGRCFCVGQLQGTWLCGEHRGEKQEDFQTKIREGLRGRRDKGLRDKCGRCGIQEQEETSLAWVCVACGSHVCQHA